MSLCSHHTRQLFVAPRKAIWYSMKSNDPGWHTHRVIAFDEGERLLFVYRTQSSNRSVCHVISETVSVKRRLRTADCRLPTRGKMQTVGKMQTAD